VKIGEVDVVATAKATFKDFKDDDLQGLAAESAYHILFSVVPLLIFLTALTGFVSRQIGVGDVVPAITDWLQRESNLPRETQQAVLEPIVNTLRAQAGGFLSFGALVALWSGKNAIATLMKALNVTFDVEETRPWWKKQLVAIGLTIGLGLALIASSLLFLAGSFIGDTVFGWIGLGDTWATVWGLLRWPLILALLIVALAFFYWAGPNVDAPFKWLTPGSLLAVVLWGVATFGLGFYFANFAGYVTTYGALGGVLAFIFWLYVMSLILLLGGELNSVLARAHSPEARAEVDAKAMSGVGAKRRAASGGETAPKRAGHGDGTGTPEPSPLPPMPAFGAVAAALPSAEGAARQALAAEDGEGRARRFRSAAAALGVAAAAAVSGALLGRQGRS